MRTSKLRQESDEDEVQISDVSDYCPAGFTDSSSKQKKRRKNVGQIDNKKKVVSRKLKSKDIQASASPKKSKSIARKRTRFADLYDNIEAQYSVVERAERVGEHLENELPHFVKYMLPSNVAHGFWLVHIVRVHDADVVSAALCLMDMDASARGSSNEVLSKTDKRRGRKRRKTEYVEPYQLDIASPVENFKGKNSILSPVADHSSNPFSSDMVEKGPEITNQHQTNDLCYPETSFLRDHAREGVTCR
ncbi:hypothetical protein SASPL_134169 [Salvia splendens]|uniref:Uncharacterized protein n=1 Tax=Salvia splendens TaxID=180675 RepID=A0A8X8X6F1_SALSN|nr:hypothetical protein SASPL_134169 [Salvia splendens]